MVYKIYKRGITWHIPSKSANIHGIFVFGKFFWKHNLKSILGKLFGIFCVLMEFWSNFGRFEGLKMMLSTKLEK